MISEDKIYEFFKLVKTEQVQSLTLKELNIDYIDIFELVTEIQCIYKIEVPNNYNFVYLNDILEYFRNL
jgi:acyl carrier protein